MYSLWCRSVYKHTCVTTAKYFTIISTTYIGNDPVYLTVCYFSCLMYLEEESRNMYKQCSSLWLDVYPTFFLLLSSPEFTFSIHWFFLVILIWQVHLCRTVGTCFSYSCYHLQNICSILHTKIDLVLSVITQNIKEGRREYILSPHIF